MVAVYRVVASNCSTVRVVVEAAQKEHRRQRVNNRKEEGADGERCSQQWRRCHLPSFSWLLLSLFFVFNSALVAKVQTKRKVLSVGGNDMCSLIGYFFLSRAPKIRPKARELGAAGLLRSCLLFFIFGG